MLRSRSPSKRQKSRNSEGRPPWDDPETRVTLARATIVRIESAHGKPITVVLPTARPKVVLSALLYSFRGSAKGGAR